jgi:Heparinase II/III N-terminus
MSASEMGWRAVDVARRQAWSRNQAAPGSPFPAPPGRRSSGGSGASKAAPRFEAILPEGTLARVPGDSAAPVIAAAAGILAGEWSILGVPRKDIVSPDWFFDPVTSIRAPQAEYCFRIDHRREDVTGNVKQVWELSRMHHITVLASAYALSGDSSYAEAAAEQLQSWWAANPFLSGSSLGSGLAGCWMDGRARPTCSRETTRP